MFSTINNIGNFASKVTKQVGARSILAAAVATLGLSATSFGAFSDVTSITTHLTVGTPATVTNVAADGSSPFKYGTNWNITYDNEIEAITSLTAGGQTYDTTGLATNAIRRFDGPSNYQYWYDGTYNPSGKTATLQGPLVYDFKQGFDANDLLGGIEGAGSGNGTNVDRLDLVFSGGIKASASEAFSIIERGNSNSHDGFKIAAITSLDSHGNPSGYGPLISVATGTWGKTNLVTPEEAVILNETAAEDTLHPMDQDSEGLGGVLVKTSDLVSPGTEIYGYSLFSSDVKGSGGGLVDWTNTNCYPNNPDTGFDPSAVVSNLYTLVPVPEPTSASLMVLAAGSLMVRRSKRRAR